MNQHRPLAGDPLHASPTDYGPAVLVELQAMHKELRRTRRAAQTAATCTTVWLILTAIWLARLFVQAAMIGAV